MYSHNNFARVVSAVLLAMASIGANAELIATPLPGDTRLVEFPYNEDNTYLVLTKPKALTHLQFAADEVVTTTAAGDTAQWSIEVTKNRKNIFVKPRYENLDTSLTVLTDKRAYQFVLKSTTDGKKWYQRVAWQYQNAVVLEIDGGVDAASEPAAKVQVAHQSASPAAGVSGIDPKNIKFGYQITGDAPFKPISVFDDGKFTYLKMSSSVEELPALFAIVEDQQYALVNYTVDGDYLIAQRLLTEGVLKLGKSEVKISKKKPRTFLGIKFGDQE